MATLLAIITLGFLLGMRHATDPDHVVAVSTIVSRERSLSQAALIGAMWGAGHMATILAVGTAIILLKVSIPPALGLTMELSVALMLVLLGILNLTGVTRRTMEWFSVRGGAGRAHTHVTGGRVMVHIHDDGAPPVEAAVNVDGQPRIQPLTRFHLLRPLIVGIVHGLAGSAAIALLVLASITKPTWAIGYLFVFGLGTVAGMMLITGAIALPFAYTQRHFVHLNQVMAMASGVISLGFGLFLCYQTGFVDGLFTGHPSWIPR
jgi:ABC-type nickel/cobalt efflux system permease component RcnA